MTIFFGLGLPEALKAHLGAWQAAAREAGLRAAFPRPEGLHLTLVFLGAQEVGALPGLLAVGAEAASRHRPFSLRTAALGAFPGHGRARVLWLGLESSEALGDLQGDLARMLHPGTAQPFVPHLTLARPKAGGVPEGLPEVPAPVAFDVGELLLFESRAEAGGRRYEPLGRWALNRTSPPR